MGRISACASLPKQKGLEPFPMKHITTSEDKGIVIHELNRIGGGMKRRKQWQTKLTKELIPQSIVTKQSY